MNTCSDQFEVLSNALRIFPERLVSIKYFIVEVNDPEEGIANIESAFRDVLNQFYGMMCALKESGNITGLYEHIEITSLLCLRHAVQHKSGKVKNQLRDLILDGHNEEVFLIEYSTSDADRLRGPFPINLNWVEESIKSSNYASKWAKISEYWNLNSIIEEAKTHNINLNNIYIDGTNLISEAVCTLQSKYGQFYSPIGYDSKVYYKHFANIVPYNKNDFALIA